MKAIKEYKFHSRDLVPWEVAEKGRDAVIDFYSDINRGNYILKPKFKEGDAVAHRENIGLKMFVKEVQKVPYKSTDVGGKEKVRFRMQGVLCYWWVGGDE